MMGFRRPCSGSSNAECKYLRMPSQQPIKQHQLSTLQEHTLGLHETVCSLHASRNINCSLEGLQGCRLPAFFIELFVERFPCQVFLAQHKRSVCLTSRNNPVCDAPALVRARLRRFSDGRCTQAFVRGLGVQGRSTQKPLERSWT